MRDEKNIEDAQAQGNELFLDVCESFRYGMMSYTTEQLTPRDVQMQRRIQKIEDPTQKYIEYLRLSSKPAAADIALHHSEASMNRYSRDGAATDYISRERLIFQSG
jgi:hypothetical protein